MGAGTNDVADSPILSEESQDTDKCHKTAQTPSASSADSSVENEINSLPIYHAPRDNQSNELNSQSPNNGPMDYHRSLRDLQNAIKTIEKAKQDYFNLRSQLDKDVGHGYTSNQELERHESDELKSLVSEFRSCFTEVDSIFESKNQQELRIHNPDQPNLAIIETKIDNKEYSLSSTMSPKTQAYVEHYSELLLRSVASKLKSETKD